MQIWNERENSAELLRSALWVLRSKEMQNRTEGELAQKKRNEETGGGDKDVVSREVQGH